MYSDGANLVASDGQRMAVIDTPLPKGYYDDDLNLLDVDHTFINFERVIPKGHSDTLITSVEKIMLLPRKPYRNSKTECVELTPGCWFQFNYVKDAIALAGKGAFEIHYSTENGNGSVKILFPEFLGALAVIMPLRDH